MIFTYIAVILRIFSNPLGNAFQKQLTGRGYSPLTVNFLTFLLLSIVCLIPAQSVHWTTLPASFWIYSSLAGIFGATGNGFLVKALQKGDLSVLGPINSYKSVIGLLAGILLLNEWPTWKGLAGIFLIIGGSYFIFDTLEEGFSRALLKNKEIRYRVLAMVLTAIEAVFIKKVILWSDTTTSFIMWCWFGAFFSGMLLFIFRLPVSVKPTKIPWKDIRSYLALAFCIGIMQYTTNYVFDRMNVGYALALFQLSTIVAIFLGYRLFHEKNILPKLLGSVIMMGGSILIIFAK